MFVQDYLIPGFQLVKSHQRVILHTFVFMLLGLLLAVVGTLISVVPLVAALTYSGISVTEVFTELTLETLQTTILGDSIIIVGAVVSVLLFALNLLIWKAFFLGGVIRSVIDPQKTVGKAIKLAFGGIAPTIKPMILIWVVLVLIAGVFGGGYWYLRNQMTGMEMVSDAAAVVGVLISLIFILFAGLSPIVTNMDGVGVIEALKRSKRAVMADFLNFIGLGIVLGLINGVVGAIPVFDVIVSWILIPITIASFAGYYHLNQAGPAPKKEEKKEIKKVEPTKVSELKPVEHKPKPKPEPEEKPSRFETDDQRTKRILNKILKEI